MLKVSVIGAGSWGTALANVAASNDNNMTYLWSRRKELAEELRKTCKNEMYLPGAKFSSKIIISSDIEEAVTRADIVIIAVPSQNVREITKKIKPFLKEEAIIVSAAKGIELKSLKLMSQVIREELKNMPGIKVVALSGPSHAEEVIKGLPTAVVAASVEEKAAQLVQQSLMNKNFRIYTNTDIIGVELGGALKNVIAISSGISDGLGFGDNTRAALMTRGIVEIARLGIKMGASSTTFSGLSGIGDLIVTCNSNFSRNRKAGIQIGKGKSVKEVIESSNMVIEGINSTFAAYSMAKQYDIPMPITEQAYLVLFDGKDPLTAVNSLMNRNGKNECEDIIAKEFFIIN